MLYIWDLNVYGNLGWVVTLIYIICCCLRLARFNLTSNIVKNPILDNFFTGVPSPAGAGIVLLHIIISLGNFSYLLDEAQYFPVIIIIISSFLMISKIPTYAFKKIKITKAYVLLIMLFSVLLFGFLITYTFNTLFVIGVMYLLSIPVSFFHLRYLKNKHNLKTDSDESLISEDVL